MITFKKPKIKIEDSKAIVTCDVLIGDKKKEIFYEIDKKYKDYLCIERSDAFIIAAIHYAMKHHHDITCDFPLTSSIYHNLINYLIPTLANHSNNLTEIKLNVPLIEEPIKTKGAVATGISCGIDSMHVLKNYLNPECKDMKLDYLCLNNVGSFNAYAEKYEGIGSNKARKFLIERATKVANKVNLPLIITNSNIHKVFNDEYFRVHTFANMFSVFMMQKLFSKYLYASSGYDLAHYNVCDSKTLDSAEYELLIFNVLSTDTLKIYSEGSQKTRLEKTIDIADFDLAKENLHVCIKDGINCGKCIKCKRTILALDIIGKLENFKNVFDIEYYKKHKDEYYNWLEEEAENQSLMNIPTYKLLKQKSGKTIYKDIEEYNKNNIIIPENDIESISIKKDDYILNKNSQKEYVNNLYYRLATCVNIAKLKNMEISIHKNLLNNVKFSYKNIKNLKYFRQLFNKRKISINLYDLVYFILYKPKSAKKIIKFLQKEGYLKDNNNIHKKHLTSTKDLANIFKEFIKYDVLKDALKIDTITIKNKTINNKQSLNNCKSIYYKNNEYEYTFVEIKDNMYYFLGLSNNYVIVMISKYKNKKNEICEDSTIGYSLIKKLIKFDNIKNK